MVFYIVLSAKKEKKRERDTDKDIRLIYIKKIV